MGVLLGPRLIYYYYYYYDACVPRHMSGFGLLARRKSEAFQRTGMGADCILEAADVQF